MLQVDKVYNESDPNVDLKERDEEIERMREHVLETVSYVVIIIEPMFFFIRVTRVCF